MRTSLALVAVSLIVAVALAGCGKGKAKLEPGTPLTDIGSKTGGGNATADDAVKSLVKACLARNEKELKALFAPDCAVPPGVLLMNTQGWRDASSNLADYNVVRKDNDTFVVRNRNTGQGLTLRFKAIDGKYFFVEGSP